MSRAALLCERAGDIRQLEAARARKHCVEESYKQVLVVINRQTGVDAEALAARAPGGGVKLLELNNTALDCTSDIGVKAGAIAPGPADFFQPAVLY